MSDEQIFSAFCPICHLATLGVSEQSRGYNKCTFCGYTEENSKTDKRYMEWKKKLKKKVNDFK